MANQIPESTTTRPAADDPYTKATHSSATDPHPMPPRQISEKELADKSLAAQRPEQAAGKTPGKFGQPLATGTGVLANRENLAQQTAGQRKDAEAARKSDTQRKDDTKKSAPGAVKVDHALEQAHKEKVEREKDIMRDPHEDDEKGENEGWKKPMPKYGTGKDQVSALRISEVRPLGDKKTQLVFMDSNYPPIEVDPPWITANRPVAGGWYVVDGKGRRFLNATDFAHHYQQRGVAV